MTYVRICWTRRVIAIWVACRTTCDKYEILVWMWWLLLPVTFNNSRKMCKFYSLRQAFVCLKKITRRHRRGLKPGPDLIIAVKCVSFIPCGACQAFVCLKKSHEDIAEGSSPALTPALRANDTVVPPPGISGIIIRTTQYVCQHIFVSNSCENKDFRRNSSIFASCVW